jgi:chromosome segregation ATPase
MSGYALIKRAREFAEGLTAKLSGNTDSSSVEDLKKRKSELEQRLVATQKEEEKTAQAVHKLHSDIENEKDANREAERELFQAMAERSGVESMLAGLRARENILAQNLENYKIELREAAVLLLRDAQRFEEYVVRDEAGDALSDAEIFEEERSKQEERRRKLERMKIRLEEIGAGNSEEILKEHKETTERDQFLMRELEDLHASKN